MTPLENDQVKVRNLKSLSPFVVFFALENERVFIKTHIALKVDVLQDRKIYCLQARPRIFQPGIFTVRGSEGVKVVRAVPRRLTAKLQSPFPLMPILINSANIWN